MIRPKGKSAPIIYVEAEGLNTDLYSKSHGVSQVNEWLLSRASKTDYGLATDGFKWILLKFDTVSAQSKVFLKVDLRPIFLKLLNPISFVTEDVIKGMEETFLNLDCECVSSFLRGYLEIIEKKKEAISPQTMEIRYFTITHLGIGYMLILKTICQRLNTTKVTRRTQRKPKKCSLD